VWPHDNALIAAGFARYGLKQFVAKLFTALFEASAHMDLHRMPELFCGFPRRQGEGPVLYPVACAPQSWAAGSVFLLLQACLDLCIDLKNSQIRFTRPLLPEVLKHVQLRNIRAGGVSLDLSIRRYPHNVGINLLRRDGNVEIVVLK
jgi:glycogen debranching enzyme